MDFLCCRLRPQSTWGCLQIFTCSRKLKASILCTVFLGDESLVVLEVWEYQKMGMESVLRALWLQICSHDSKQSLRISATLQGKMFWVCHTTILIFNVYILFIFFTDFFIFIFYVCVDPQLLADAKRLHIPGSWRDRCLRAAGCHC